MDRRSLGRITLGRVTLGAVAAAAVALASCGSDEPAAVDDGPATAAPAAPTIPATVEPTTAPDPTTAPEPTAAASSEPVASAAPEPTDPASTTSTDVPGTTTTAATGPAAPSPSGPIVAIDAEGDAVLLADPSADPVLLYDGPSPEELAAVTEGPGPNSVDHVSATPDGAIAYVGTCCEPVSGVWVTAEPPEAATFEGTPNQGYVPTVSPDGSLLAVGSISGVVGITERETGELLAVDDGSGLAPDVVGAFSPYDVMWVSPERFAVLGIAEREWVVVPGTVTPGDGVTLRPAFAVAPFDGALEEVHGFAGSRSPDEVLVHVDGEGAATAFRLDGTDLGEYQLEGPSRSAWIVPEGPSLRVDDAGTLTVGTETVPGEYLWART
ncbi:hypothetical protein [Ilumatobacter sp.]|uniref:hypothetical protein n=1 Tax=Ilumatobacter sp. TaxID=1967498 RepID=UPI003B51D9ED